MSTYQINEEVMRFTPKMAQDKVVFRDFNLWYGEKLPSWAPVDAARAAF